MVTITDFNSVLELYAKAKPIPPNRQKINYGLSVVGVGGNLTIEWVVWLGMFKFYQMNPQVRDSNYGSLKRIITHIMGENAMELLESENVDSAELFGG